MSAAAEKYSPVVKTDKCPTTVRSSPLVRSCLFGGAHEEPILVRAERDASSHAKCEDDDSRRQRSRYLMIYRQLLPGFVWISFAFSAPLFCGGRKGSHRLTRHRVWEAPLIRKLSQQEGLWCPSLLGRPLECCISVFFLLFYFPLVLFLLVLPH